MPAQVRMTSEMRYGVYNSIDERVLRERDFGDLIFSSRRQAEAVAFAFNTELESRDIAGKSVTAEQICSRIEKLCSEIKDKYELK